MNARVRLAAFVLSFVAPALAAGQGAGTRVSIQGTVGTNINAGGDNQSVSVGFSPNEHWDLLLGAERIHLPTEVTRFGATRGGTTTFISGEVRFVPFTFDRVSPYVLASIGRGVARPNVNEIFPDRVTNGLPDATRVPSARVATRACPRSGSRGHTRDRTCAGRAQSA